ncbi:hypothetical protein [Kallotenue papyrolyticum]|uniref:hypothetical protein n=1 Tax=Kallotenue papyrolyticum TaxID=1325125 RepID=UPI000472A620|nr:hypothetical protein [Kallotenue papyrolyticum]
MLLRPSVVGLILGLLLGYFLLTRGVGFALGLGVCGLLGWLIAKLISGEIDLQALRSAFARRIE